MLRLTIVLAVIGTPAAAHIGHLSGLAGHDHWIAGIAIGAAIGVGLWGALKGRKEDPEPEEIEPEEDPA